MRFSRILVENWRNFGFVEVPLQDRAFLLGPNASGKSNFLDVFRFLRDLATPAGGFQGAVADRGGVSRVRNLAARAQPNVAIEAALEDSGEEVWRYRVAFAQDKQRRAILREEKVWTRGRVLLDRPDASDRSDEARLRQTHLEQTIANREFREIADFFGSVRYYHIVPQLIRDPERSTGVKRDPYGGDFLEQIAQTDGRTRTARLKHILSALKVAVPQLDELKLERDSRGTTHMKGRYKHWRPQGAWQTEADFSDGTLRLMGLLWAVLDGTGPLLLEEPELSLHPEIVRQIPQLLIRVQRRLGRPPRQVLLSTHSGDLLRDEGIAADEILLVIPAAEGSQIQVGAADQEVRRLLQLGLTAAEVVIPRTRPDDVGQLSLL